MRLFLTLPTWAFKGFSRATYVSLTLEVLCTTFKERPYQAIPSMTVAHSLFFMASIVGLEPTIQFNLYDRLAICSITIIAYRQNGVGDEN